MSRRLLERLNHGADRRGGADHLVPLGQLWPAGEAALHPLKAGREGIRVERLGHVVKEPVAGELNGL